MKIIASELAELLVSWQLKLRAENKSPRTLRAYRDGVNQFLRWCDDTDTPPVLTKMAAQGFLSSLLDNGAESNTVRARYSALKRFSKWLASEGETPVDLLADLGAPSLDTKIVDPLTEDELRGFIKACQGNRFQDRRDEAIVRLMAETAVRAGECAALKFADIDTVAGRAIVYRGKGGQGRVVHFGPHTAAVLDRYMRARRSHKLAGTPALWLGERSTTFSYASLYRTLIKRAERAGIDGFHPHRFRHTAATRWLAAGGSEGGLMAIAGWKSREMLDRYTRATASDRAADEARKLNLGDL